MLRRWPSPCSAIRTSLPMCCRTRAVAGQWQAGARAAGRAASHPQPVERMVGDQPCGSARSPSSPWPSGSAVAGVARRLRAHGAPVRRNSPALPTKPLTVCCSRTSAERLRRPLGARLPALRVADLCPRGHVAHHKDEFGPNEPDLNLYNGYPITGASISGSCARSDLFGNVVARSLKGLLSGLRYNAEPRAHAAHPRLSGRAVRDLPGRRLAAALFFTYPFSPSRSPSRT